MCKRWGVVFGCGGHWIFLLCTWCKKNPYYLTRPQGLESLCPDFETITITVHGAVVASTQDCPGLYPERGLFAPDRHQEGEALQGEPDYGDCLSGKLNMNETQARQLPEGGVEQLTHEFEYEWAQIRKQRLMIFLDELEALFVHVQKRVENEWKAEKERVLTSDAPEDVECRSRQSSQPPPPAMDYPYLTFVRELGTDNPNIKFWTDAGVHPENWSESADPAQDPSKWTCLYQMDFYDALARRCPETQAYSSLYEEMIANDQNPPRV